MAVRDKSREGENRLNSSSHRTNTLSPETRSGASMRIIQTDMTDALRPSQTTQSNHSKNRNFEEEQSSKRSLEVRELSTAEEKAQTPIPLAQTPPPLPRNVEDRRATNRNRSSQIIQPGYRCGRGQNIEKRDRHATNSEPNPNDPHSIDTQSTRSKHRSGSSSASDYAAITEARKDPNHSSSTPKLIETSSPPSRNLSSSGKLTADLADGQAQPDLRTIPDAFDTESDQKGWEDRAKSTAQGGIVNKITSAFIGGSQSRDREPQNYKDDPKRQDRRDQTLMELDNYKAELHRAIGECHVSKRQCQDLQSENHRLKDAVQALQHELNNVQRMLEDAKTLSETRGKELQGAQVFLTKADSLAISDLIQQVNSVNEEIFQAAASLGETLIRRKRDLSEDEARSAYQSSCNVIGIPATVLLYAEAQKSDTEINPLLVQVVLQIVLTAFCAGKIQTWTPGEPVFDHHVRGLYKEIRRSSKDQAVSGRWRALTLAHLNPDTQKWKNEVIKALVNIMRVASWDIGTVEQKSNFGHQLLPIFKATVDLRVSLGQKITSADIEVAYISAGDAFAKAHMEESYGDDQKENNNNEKVLATVGIGLHKVMPPSSTPTLEPVVPPKVVLESSLKEALEPAPPRTSRSGKKSSKPKTSPLLATEMGPSTK